MYSRPISLTINVKTKKLKELCDLCYICEVQKPTSFPGSLFYASLSRWNRDPGNEVVQIQYNLVTKQSFEGCLIKGLGARFSKVPRLFGRISGDIILFVSSKRRRLEARNIAVILIFIPFTTYKKQLYRISRSEFYKCLFGPEKFEGLSTNGPLVWKDTASPTVLAFRIKLYYYKSKC